MKKKYRLTTNSNHIHAISDNHLDRNFKPKALNEAWVSDLTYIRTDEDCLYLTTVVGWSLSKTLFTKETITPAWKMATSKRKIDNNLIFHSDRGIQYASKEFRNHINTNNLITQITPSIAWA